MADNDRNNVENLSINVLNEGKTETVSSRYISICHQRNSPNKNITVLYPPKTELLKKDWRRHLNKDEEELEIIEEVVIFTTERQTFVYHDQARIEGGRYKLFYGEEGYAIRKDSV